MPPPLLATFLATACLGCCALSAASQTSPKSNWIEVLKSDPRLQVKMNFNYQKDPALDGWFGILGEATKLSFSLAEPPADGKPAFNGQASQGMFAHRLLISGANANFDNAWWEKTDDGYRLHGTPKKVISPGEEKDTAAKRKARDEAVAKATKNQSDFTAKFPHLAQLRADQRLHVKLSFVEHQPKLPDMIRHLETATRLRLTISESLAHHDPDFGMMDDIRPGYFNFANHSAWMLMELIGDRDLTDGRWVKTDDGYRLEGESRALRLPPPPPPVWPWVVAAIAFVAVGSAGVYRWRFKKSG
jgi:hypothetical protein